MRNWWMGVCILAMIFFGYYQENVKVAINYRIALIEKFPELDALAPDDKEKRAEELTPFSTIDYYYGHARIGWVNYFSLSGLRQMKWWLTLLFALCFLALNILLATLMGMQKQVLRRLALMYLFLFASALLVFFLGKVTGFAGECYAIARKMVGLLQSPLPLMTIWLSRKLIKRNEP